MRAGRHVALMRHADAPGGIGDPPGFRLDDCATQRNLSDKGRADAMRWHGSGILLVVTHGANIFDITSVSPASGEIVVVPSGGRKPVGRLRLD